MLKQEIEPMKAGVIKKVTEHTEELIKAKVHGAQMRNNKYVVPLYNI